MKKISPLTKFSDFYLTFHSHLPDIYCHSCSYQRGQHMPNTCHLYFCKWWDILWHSESIWWWYLCCKIVWWSFQKCLGWLRIGSYRKQSTKRERRHYKIAKVCDGSFNDVWADCAHSITAQYSLYFHNNVFEQSQKNLASQFLNRLLIRSSGRTVCNMSAMFDSSFIDPFDLNKSAYTTLVLLLLQMFLFQWVRNVQHILCKKGKRKLGIQIHH